MDIVEANLSDKPWCWWRLSRNPNLTLKIIKDNMNKPWD